MIKIPKRLQSKKGLKPIKVSKVLAIDFDGVIHDYKHPIEGRRMGLPISGAKESLLQFKQKGYTIIIHSVRGGSSEHIAAFMDYYGLTYDTITNIKPNADYYIDDKAVKFTDWDNVNTIIYG